MKKFIGLFLLAGMLANITFLPQETGNEIIETQELPAPLTTEYLTKEDFSLLYTCKSYEPPINTEIVEVTYEEAQILMRIAQAEDCTDAKSQALIMSVVLNRVNSEDFPNTIKEVVEQDNQFSPVEDGRFAESEPTGDSHYALYLIESGTVKTDYLYFEALTCKDSWQSKHRGTPYEYGSTRFYQ